MILSHFAFVPLVLYSAQYNIYSILFDRRQEAVITTPKHERTNERIVG